MTKLGIVASLLLINGCFLCGIGTAQGVTYYVDPVSGNDANSGSSWGSAFQTLSNAVIKAKAVVGPEIRVAAGTQTWAIANGMTVSNETIIGGYQNGGSTPDWIANPSILDGQSANRAFNKTGADTFTLNGFTIRNCTNSGSGGAMAITVGSIGIYNCFFTNNLCANYGGAIYHQYTGANNVFSNCSFIANSSGAGGGYHGGAVVIWQASTNTFQNCTFITNATYNSSAAGGAIYENTAGGLLKITSCIFSNNVAGSSGGAISSQSSMDLSGGGNVFYGNRCTPNGYGGAIYHQNTGANNVFSNCTFIANASAAGGGYHGGAIEINQTSTNDFRNCIFITNSAANSASQGGAIHENTAGGLLKITSCIFSNNVAGSSGGAISSQGTLDLSGGSNVFYANRCTPNGYGGAIYHQNTGANNVFSNCTFIANASGASGGYHGGAIEIWQTSVNTFQNCIFITNAAANSASQGGAIHEYAAGGILKITSCIFSNNVSGSSGGAISSQSSMDLSGGSNVFYGNRCSSGGHGGAIYHQNTGANNVFSNCTFIGNASAAGSGYHGGAIMIWQACNNTFQNCAFITNVAANSAACGGAIYEYTAGGSVKITGCVFSNNVAGSSGGAIYSLGTLDLSGGSNMFYRNRCTPNGYGGAIFHSAAGVNNVINDCTFIANASGAGSTYHGGAVMFWQACTSVFQNCAFITNATSNAGAGGGAIDAESAGLYQLINCNFITNSAGSSGGAIRTASASATVVVNNCIFWGNTSGGTGTNIQNSGIVNISYSLIGTNVNQVNGGTKNFGAGIINTDPLFASMVEPFDLHEQSQYGRWTAGGWSNDGITSPCIDAGDPVSDPTLEPQPNGGRINIGRYGNTPQASKSATSGMLVKNDRVTNCTVTAATLIGQLMMTNDSPTAVYIYYGETDVYSNKAAWGFFTTNGLNVALGGLTSTVAVAADKFYYWRCHASNATSMTWSPVSNTFISGQVTLQAADNGASETGDKGSFVITRPAGTEGGPITVYYQVSGSAINGTDYQAINNSVVMNAGALSTTIVITANVDFDRYEPDETVTLTLTAGNYAIGAQSNDTVTITNNQWNGLYYVNGGVADDTGDGLSWATAFKTLTNAFVKATGEFWVVGGTYTPGSAATNTFYIRTNYIYGGFAGTETTRSQRDWTNNLTTLSGDLGGSVYANNIITKQVAGLAILDGFTLRDARGVGNYGAGVSNASGSMAIQNCIFSNLYANSSGGAIYSAGTAIGATNCSFFGCYVTNGNGGAVYCTGAGLNTFYSCLFVSNWANRPTDQWGGGAVCLAGANNTNAFSNCVFVGNCTTNETASSFGGAIRVETASSTMALIDCVFTNNRTKTIGGAIYAPASYVGMTNCTFAGNYTTNAGYAGAISLPSAGLKSFSNCVFMNNWVSAPADQWGGAVVIPGAGNTNVFRKCVFVGNYTTNEVSSSFGGAIRVEQANSGTALIDCVFTNNRAKTVGGACYLPAAYVGITNCTFAGNYTTNVGYAGALCLQSAGLKSISNCVFLNNWVSAPADQWGGAVVISGAGNTNVFRNCVFLGNYTTNEAGNGYGGAIRVEQANSDITMVDCAFTNNRTKTSGGAIYTSGLLSLTRCDFAGNQATNGYGGAIYKSSAHTNVFINCSFVTNWAKVDGGAVYFDNSSATGLFLNCTFFANVANTGNGGAIRTYNAGTLLNIGNCIFWGDWCGGSGQEIYNAGVVTISYSDINDVQVTGTGTKNIGYGNIMTNPLFASITAPYDMHEQSRYGRWYNGGWVKDALKSSCIDAGDPSGAYNLEPLPNGDRLNMGRYGNTPEASISFIVGFRNISSTNITATTADVIGMLAGSNATCYVLYDTNNWGATLSGWANTNLLGSRVNGETVTNNLVSLQSNFRYYYVFYGTNTTLGEEGYSVIASFTTKGPPNVNNAGGATNIMAKTASLMCTVVTSHQANATIYYGTTDGGTVIGDWQFSTNVGLVTEGTYTLDVRDLLTNQLYYYRCYATNVIGDAWATSSVSFITTPAANLTPWNRKMLVTFSGYNKTESLTNIPMLIVLSNNVGNSGFSYSDFYSTNGYDLRFSDYDQLNELQYEVEKWDPAGISYVWVKIPVLSNTTTRIWLFSGRAWQTNWQATCTNGTVWANSFRAVWHLNNNELDSGLFKKNVSALNVTNVVGQIAGGKQFYNNGWMDVPEVATNMDRVTYSVWLKLPGLPDDLDSILDTDNWNPGDMQLMFRNTGKIRLSINGNTPQDAESTYAFGGGDWNQWRYVTVVYDRISKTSLFYVNAVSSTNIPYMTTVPGSLTVANIGSYNISRYFNGTIDEFSIADAARSSNWIWACYMNMASNTNFISYGTVSNACPILWSTPYATDILTNAADLVATLISSNADCKVMYDTSNWGMSLDNWRFTNDLGSIAAGATVTNNITNLLSNTYYFYMFYATNTVLGTNRFSEVNWFTTISIPVVNNQNGPSNITAMSALLGYSIVTSHHANVTIYYGTTDCGTVSADWGAYTNLGVIENTGTYAVAVDDLIAGKTYYYRCYATNGAGDAWAPVVTNFNTLSPIFVDTNLVSGANNGTSWADAYRDISVALTNAPSNSVVWFAKGTYALTGSVNITSNRVSMYGGFNSGATWEQRDWTNNLVILKAVPEWGTIMRVYTNDVTLNGLVFSNAQNACFSLYSYGDRIKLENCRFHRGFPVTFYGSNTTVSGCSFYDMAGEWYGGSIYATQSLVVTDSLFERSSASQVGGTVVFDAPGSYLTITNCVFRRNYAGINGAAVYVRRGLALIYGCSFVSNVAKQGGSAIYFENNAGVGNAIIKNCAFAQNISTNYAGAVTHARFTNSISLTIENCSFYSNYVGQSTAEGGAVMMNTVPLYIRNSIFWQNNGGVLNGNEISSSGLVEYAYSSFTGTNNIYIDVKGTVYESNNIIADPQFASAVDLHLKSSLGRWDPSVTNWVLDPVDSPCIDMGDSASIYTNEPAPNGSRINLGAYGNTVQASKSVTVTLPTAEDSSNSVNYTSAIIRGRMTAGKKGELTLFYGDNDGETNALNWDNSYSIYVTESQEVSRLITKLNPFTTYYYRTYVTNAAGEDWSDGATLQFATGDNPLGGPSNVIHVNPAATNAWFNDGSSWIYACLTIQDGLNRLNNITNEMWVAKHPVTNYDISVVIDVLVSNITIYGGFNGTETNRSQRDWTNNQTILKIVPEWGSAMKVYTNDVTLNGLVFSNAQGSCFSLYSYGDRTKVENCRFHRGYPVTFYGSNTIVSGCSFYDMAGEWYGGSIYATQSLVVTDSLFERSSASQVGGTVLFDAPGSYLAITNCVFRRNYAAINGASVYIRRGLALIYGCSFVSNVAKLGGSSVYFENNAGVSNAIIKNCAFAQNISTNYGGTITHARSTNDISLIVENCSFYSNIVAQGSVPGGALMINKVPAYIRNCIFWQNKGGALTGNEISSSGAVEYSYSSFTGTNNTYIDVKGAASESNNVIADPQFASIVDLHLKSSVGRWDPVVTNWVTDTFNSPCIDMGDPASAYANEPDPNGGRINLGAYGNTVQASKTVVETSPTADDSTSSVNYTTAIIRGKMTAGKKGTLTLYYGNDDGHFDPAAWDSSQSFIVSENEEVALMIRNLSPQTLYYYRTFVTNSAGYDWSDTGPSSLSFLTGDPLPSGAGNVIYVNPAATNAWFNDGSSWTYACLTLSEGLARLNSVTNEMWVAKHPMTNYIIQTALDVLTANAAIYGGFNGTETQRSQRDWTNNQVVLKILPNWGTAMRVYTNDVTLNGLVFSNAIGSCYPLYAYGDRIKLENCRFHLGFPVTFYGSNTTVSGCSFYDMAGEWYGGSIYATQSLVVTDSLFERSYASQAGGTVVFDAPGSYLLMTNCVFRWNHAAINGAAVYVRKGVAQIYNSTFVSNYADASGGAIAFEDSAQTSNAVIRNCVFNCNTGVVYGGAVYHGAQTTSINLAIVNCSFNSNVIKWVNGYGAAVYMQRAPLYVTNSILWGNACMSNNVGIEINSASGSVTVSYSCMEGTNATYLRSPNGTSYVDHIVVSDPLFASAVDLHLKSKFGRWQNGLWVYDGGIMSPCVDAGDPASAYNLEPQPNGGRINMGAYGNTPQASKNGKPASIIIIR